MKYETTFQHLKTSQLQLEQMDLEVKANAVTVSSI